MMKRAVLVLTLLVGCLFSNQIRAEEAKAVIPQTIDEDELETILAGAKSCPVDAIIIRDQNGKKIYPK